MSSNVIDKLLDQLAESGTGQNSSCSIKENDLDFLSLRSSAKEVERRKAELENEDKDGDIKLKRMYGIAIIVVLGLWELFVIIFTFMQICPERRVSDAVLITLLTTATANILVLPAIVLKYLFPKR